MLWKGYILKFFVYSLATANLHEWYTIVTILLRKKYSAVNQFNVFVVFTENRENITFPVFFSEVMSVLMMWQKKKKKKTD